MLKTIKNGVIMGTVALIIICAGFYIFIKARQSSSTGLPTDSNPSALYVNEGETLTAAKWNNLVNKSSFSAYASAPQSIISTRTRTKLNMNTEVFDTNNEFDPSTGRFTPKRVGKYLLIASCFIDDMTNGDGANTGILKNGTINKAGNYSRNGAKSDTNSVITAIIDANGSTDYFEAGCWSTITASTIAGENTTYFAGFKI